MSSTTFETASADETLAFGAWLGKRARPGWVIGLSGDLGAGKTTLVQGIARGAGAEEGVVTSPTFTFLHVYEGRLPVYHLDLYRLETAEQMRDLGVEEFLGGDGLAVVEWFENVPGALPEERLELRLEVTGEAERRITATARGKAWDPIVEELARGTWRSGA